MSPRFLFSLIALIVTSFAVDVLPADARASRVGQLPNGSSFGCANCHVNSGGGGARNSFGLAIENGFLNGSGFSASVNWNATIAGQDADGDGVTNGAELGDPDGDGNPDASLTVTNPGDATSFAVQQPVDDTPTRPEVAAGEILSLVDGVELTPGVTGIVEPGVHEYELVFGVEIEGRVEGDDVQTRNLDVEIWPSEIQDGIREVKLSDDRLALIVSIDIGAESFFRIRVDAYPGNPEGSTVYLSGTREAPTGGIAGSVTLDERIDPIRGGAVILFPAARLDEVTGDAEEDGKAVDRVLLTQDFTFEFENIDDGDYILLLRGQRGPDARPLRAVYDGDGDGAADIVSVVGEVVSGIDFLIQPPPAPEPFQVASLTIAGQTIEEGVSSAPIAPGPQDFVITFNRPLQPRFSEDGRLDLPFDFDLIPALGGEEGPVLSPSEDGLSVSGSLDFPENATYQLVFGPARIGAVNRQNFFFGTTELPGSSVSGSLALPEGIDTLPERSAGLVVLVTEEALAEVRTEFSGETEAADAAGKVTLLTQLLDQEPGTLEPVEEDDPDLQADRTVRQAIRIDVPDASLGFNLSFVPDGTYLIGASTQIPGPDGTPPRRLVGFYDPDGTGSPAQVTVSGGDVTDLAVQLKNPAPPPPRLRLGDVLVKLLPRLRDEGIEFVDIREILPGLNEDDRRRLRQIAGDDGLLQLAELRRALGIRAPAAPPVVAGTVVDVDTEGSSLIVQDDEGADWTVVVSDEVAIEIQGEQNVLGPASPGSIDGRPATKQGRPDNPGNGNAGGNQGGGNNTDRGPNQGGKDVKPRQPKLKDIAIGASVQVFGQVTDDLTVAATRIVVLNGGIVRTTFTTEGVIAFFDPFSLSVELRSGQVIEVTRNTALTGPDGEPAEPRDLLPGTRVRISGSEATKGGRKILVAESIQVLGGRPFRVQGVVSAVNDRTISLLARAPEPIDSRARFGDARGRRVDVDDFRSLLDQGQGLQLLAKLNRFGSGIVALQIYDPDQKKPIRDDERLFDASNVAVEDVDAGLALVFQAPPDVEIPEGTPIRGDADAETDLTALVDKRVVIEGEVSDGARTARTVLVIRTLDRIDVTVTVGDFDGQGVDNDAQITVLDPDGVEIENTLQVALDRERPVEAVSGDTKFNLRPGKHRIVVRVPELSGLAGDAEFLIRDKGPGLEIVETFPVDGDVGVAESTEISITFSGSIEQTGKFLNLVAFLRPGEKSGRLTGFELSDDGQTVFLPVDLEPETTYNLQVVSAVGDDRQALRRPVNITFSTGGTVETPGTLAGTVGLVARAKQAEAVEILGGEVIAVDPDGKQAGRGAVETDGSFEIAGLRAGVYQLFATLETSTGTASGFLDENGDGAPDDVTVSSGQSISGLALDVQEPLVFEETVVEEVTISPVTLDLDGTTGDQALTFLAGEPGGEVDVAVYLTGATDLLGFDLLLEYDPTALTFVEVVEDEDESELNLMKQGGGFALGITSPGSNSVNWSVAILGPTDEQLGQGDGLLGIFRFTVNESFFGTTDVTIAQLVQESTGGATVIQPFVTAQVDGEGVTSTLVASAADESISANGGTTTVSVELTDLDGFVFSDDNTTGITFEIESGDATIDGETSVVKTVSEGQASVELAATGSGTIGVRITTSGASSVLVEVTAPGLGEGEVGPIALDANAEAGDQADRILEGEFNTGDLVTIDVAALSGVDGEVGFQVTLSYDPAQVAFSDFVGADLMAAAVPITNEISDGVIELNAAILGGQASGDSGSLGTVTFEILEGFSGQTQVELISGSFEETVEIGFGGAIVQIGGSEAGTGNGTADFDGDGVVGFTDFIQFAGVFGATPSSANWDPTFDLDGDESVGFTDFIVFAGLFGQTVKPALAKPIGVLPGGDASLHLSATSGRGENEVEVVLSVEDAGAVSGFGLSLDYDRATAELIEIVPVSASMFGADQPLLQAESESRLIVAHVSSETRTGERLDLAVARFRMLDPTASTSVVLSDVALSGPGGMTRSVPDASLAHLRQIPNDFALNQNFPNPFNPETQIAFQMPEAGNLSLIIYNTLGQQVRVLEQGPMEAGFHRVVWDGRNEIGRQVSSGIYLLRMHSGQFNTVRKMLLLK